MPETSSSFTPAYHTAAHLVPDSWHHVKEVLISGHHEGHRLLLHLLDQVSTRNISTLDLGIFKKSVTEEIDFLSKLEGIALFALLAERYGLNFGLDKQTNAFLANSDINDLADDLGITLQRSDLPWAMDVVGLNQRMHDNFDLPPEELPLDILFVVASRCRDWYEETVGHAMNYAGRHKMVLPEDVSEFLRQTVIVAYGTFAAEKDAGVDDVQAYDVVRASLGVAV